MTTLRVLIIGGGGGSFLTERCSMLPDSIVCETETPNLKFGWPMLFYVTDHFCQ